MLLHIKKKTTEIKGHDAMHSHFLIIIILLVTRIHQSQRHVVKCWEKGG